MSSVRFADAVGGNSCVIGGPFGSKLTQRDYQDDGVPVIRGTNMQGGRVIDGDFAYVSEEKWSRDFKTNTARPGDIIITQRGTLGQVSTVPLNFKYDKLVVSQSQMAVRVNSKYAHPLFVYYYLTSSSFNEYISSVTIQTGVPHINMGILRNAPVDWPDRGTQTEIAGVLSALDDKIELNRRMNETLEAQARALFRDWFVDFGPVKAKMAGDAPYLAPDLWSLFPEGLDDYGVPEGWRTYRVDEIAGHHTRSLKPMNAPSELFEHFSLPAYDDGQQPVLEPGEGIKSNKTIVPEGAILLSKLNPDIPRVWWPNAAAEHRQIASTEFLAFTAKPGFSPALLYSLFSDNTFRKRLEGMVTGTSKSHQRVSPSALRSLEGLAGDGSVFAVYGEIATSLMRKVLVNRAENLTLARTRDLLLPELMSGEIRVGEVEREVEEVL